MLAANLQLNVLPNQVLAAVGDPFQAFSAGLILGARKVDLPVLLGGGSQMLAVLAIALAELQPESRNKFVEDIAIATTSWLVKESISSSKSESSFICLMEIVASHFDVDLTVLATSLCFHDSIKQELRDYELGHVKEGVGAGALSLLAQLNGTTNKMILEACEIALDQLDKKT